MNKKRWRIEILEITGDRELLTAVLEKNGFELDDCLLTSGQFEALNNASDVRAIGLKLCQEINRISGLYPKFNMTFRLGSTQELTKDGVKHVHAAVGITSVAAITSTGNVEVINTSMTDEERAEMQRQEHIERANELVRAVRVDKDVIVVMQLLDGEPTPTELGHVVDIIQDNMNGDMSAWVTKNQLRRFSGSINHQEVFGLSARHARSKTLPPPNPMNMVEAVEFARGIADKWIVHVGTRSEHTKNPRGS